MSSRREFLGELTALGGLTTLAGLSLLPDALGPSMALADPPPPPAPGGAPPAEYTLPPLPYDYNALEPHIDEQTMRIHHDKHHAGYTKGLNEALQKLQAARDSGDFSNVQQLSRLLAFHAGGYYNHIVFWNNLAPAGKGGGGEPGETLAGHLNRDFGSIQKFRDHFSAATNAVEGNGWGVLGYHPQLKRLVVMTMMNQQDLVTTGLRPLLMCDVWEHAYYLKYQNVRADYVKAWWNVVNWKNVAERYEAALYRVKRAGGDDN